MLQPPTPYPFLASQAGQIERVTLLGAPLDRTGSFRPGSALGPEGIRWASENLETYSPELDLDLEDLAVGDLGNLDFTDLSLPAAVALIEEETGKLLDAGTLPVLLGGEHTIALPIARAVLKRHPDALILDFDAHADLREEYHGEPLCHAAWAFHVGSEFGFDHLIQLGIRSGLREEFKLGRERCRHFSMGLDIPKVVRAEMSYRPVYISLDLDVLDPSIAPGTGTPEAGGASYRELMDCLLGLADLNVVCIDVNEVAPPLDPTGVTAAVAAKLVRELILLYGTK